jgi:hypothetical protein
MGLIAGRATLRGGRFVTSAGEHQVLAGSNFLDRNFLDIGVGQIVLCFGSMLGTIHHDWPPIVTGSLVARATELSRIKATAISKWRVS